MAILTGAVGGLIGTAFHVSLEYANTVFGAYTWLIWLLPPGGLLIALMYRLTHMTKSGGTDDVIDSIRTGKHLRFMTAPLIFISTFITHLFGGSAGREGAALQLGGSIGVKIGRALRLQGRDMHTVTLCGMSALFSALFCTPLTAVFFALEVISVGIMYYAALLPCLAASLLAYGIALWLGAHPITFTVDIPSYSVDLLWRVVLLSLCCTAVSVIFCYTMRRTSQAFKKLFKNPFLRVAVGASLIIALTFLTNTNDYNGAGMDVVHRAIDNGEAVPTAWIWKIIFTAVTIGCGLKGGEIVPTMFIGSTFGCVMGSLLGLPPAFSAAIGLIAVFCGSVNCPVTSLILSIELFGSSGLLFFATACVISFILSGNFGLYHAQKIVYSKLHMSWVDRHAR
ncbi:MAG: chloride channel protein [Clostridia bacterium]|nr:chloride channel protein [Clostridia bacterium]